MPVNVPNFKRRPIIGVMGSHSNPHIERSRQVGQWIAKAGFHLLTGGGAGVMGAVSKSFVEVADRSGLALAIVPCISSDTEHSPVLGYPNPWVELPIYTHLERGLEPIDNTNSRNNINVLTSTVLILLPGGEGTESEARLAVRYGTPCIAFLRFRDEIPGLPDSIIVESDFTYIQKFVHASL